MYLLAKYSVGSVGSVGPVGSVGFVELKGVECICLFSFCLACWMRTAVARTLIGGVYSYIHVLPD